jgi:hypothetical protein
LEYDRQGWNKIELFPDKELILDLEPDKLRKSLWILTAKNKLYSLNVE